MRTHTIDDIERDLGWLYELESTGMTQMQLAQREGLSEGHMSRRLMRARRWMAELRAIDRVEVERAIKAAESTGREIPWIEIVNQFRRGHHYRLPVDQLSNLPAGLIRIGTSKGYVMVADSSDGVPIDSMPANEPAKFKPKRPRKKRASPAPA